MAERVKGTPEQEHEIDHLGEPYTTIYQSLKKIGILDVEEHAKFTAPGFMDLNVDVLAPQQGAKVIALAHNYIQNGDVMADPDMEIRIYEAAEMAEAMTYQQDGLGLYQRVYPEPGLVNLKLKKDLNSFLNTWLKNILEQGHVLKVDE